MVYDSGAKIEKSMVRDIKREHKVQSPYIYHTYLVRQTISISWISTFYRSQVSIHRRLYVAE